MKHTSHAQVRDENLRQFASDRQWECYETYWAAGNSVIEAAARLGISHQVLSENLHKVNRRAALKGYGQGQWRVPNGVPEGFVLRGQSADVNAEGNLTAAGRWDKTTREGVPEDQVVRLPDPFTIKRIATHRGPTNEVLSQWVTTEPARALQLQRLEALTEALLARVAERPALDALAPPERTEADLCAIYNVGDHHNGMYAWHRESGENWDLNLASETLKGALQRLVSTMPPAHRGVIQLLGDFFDYDGMEPVTPEHKNILDTDGRFSKMIGMGLDLMFWSIDLALQRHEEVVVIPQPGNHDPSTMRMAAQFLARFYRNEPRVSVDLTPGQFRYHRWGKNLNGICHGHEVKKLEDLALIMALDRPDDWAQALYRRWFTGHVHKFSVLEVQGVSIETAPVLCPLNAWAHGKGFRGQRAMQAILQHVEDGELERATVNPRMLTRG